MATFVRRVLALLPVLLLAFSGCKKEPASPAVPTTPTATRTALLDKSSVTPGDLVTVTTSTDLSASPASWEIGVGNRRVQLARLTTRQAVFVVPALPAGPLALDLAALGVSAAPTLTMATYPVIQNADQVITTFTTQLTSAVAKATALAKDTLAPTPAQNVALLRQLQQAFTSQQASLTAAEKLDVAYALQKMSLDAVDFGALPQRRTAADPAEAFAFIGQLFVDRMVTTVASIGLFVVAIKAPEASWTKVVAVAAAAAAVFQLLQANKLIDELANRFDFVAQLNLTGSASPLTLSSGSPANYAVSAVSRRLAAADATASTLLRTIFSSLQRLESLHQTFIDGYNQARTWFGSGTAALAPYVTPLKDAAARRQKQLEASLVKIKNVSNAAISVVATAVNNTLTLRATSSTVTAPTPLTFDVVYENSTLGVTAKQTLNATFSNVDSTAVYTAAAVGKWTMQGVDPNNNPANYPAYDTEFKANGTGVVTTSNGQKYSFTWSVVKSGTGYRIYDYGFWNTGYDGLVRSRLQWPLRGFKKYGPYPSGTAYAVVDYIKL